MKVNKHLLKWREQKNTRKNSSASVINGRTESLSQLYISLDNERDKKAIQLRAQQLEQANDIQDYQELEELAKNFDFLRLRRFLSSDDNSSTFTLIKYETSNSYKKLLAGFDFSYEYYNSKFKRLMIRILPVIFTTDSKNIENRSFFIIEIHEFKQIKLPELRLLFREFEAMKLNPILILSGTPRCLEIEIKFAKEVSRAW
jgi:hypothetical protein